MLKVHSAKSQNIFTVHQKQSFDVELGCSKVKDSNNCQLLDTNYGSLLVSQSTISFCGNPQKVVMKIAMHIAKGNSKLAKRFNDFKNVIDRINRLYKDDSQIRVMIAKVEDMDSLKDFIEDLKRIKPLKRITENISFKKYEDYIVSCKKLAEDSPEMIVESDINKPELYKVLAHYVLADLKRLYGKASQSFFRDICSYANTNRECYSCDQALDDLNNEIHKKIKCIGKSKETRKLMQKAKDDLGIELVIHDSPEFAKFLYYRLAREKQLGHNLPKKICTVENLEYYTSNKQAGAHHSNNSVFFNPLYLVSRSKKILSSALRHELGHHWHKNNVGFIYYKNLRNNLFLLSPEEAKVLQNLSDRTKASGSKDIYHLELYGRDLIIPLSYIRNNQAQNIEERLVKKLMDTVELVTKKEKLWKYALSNPLELVAVALQENVRRPYGPELTTVLKKYGCPETNFAYTTNWELGRHPILELQNS